MTKRNYGCEYHNKTDILSVKDFLLRAFYEKLKQLSSVLANVWRLEATYVKWFGM